MHALYNGMSAGELSGAVWRKSQRSNSQGACVEIARISAGTVAMRNSRDPQGPALICQRDAIMALMAGLQDGNFDYLVNWPGWIARAGSCVSHQQGAAPEPGPGPPALSRPVGE